MWKHPINSIQKRLFGEYTRLIIRALYEACFYHDGLGKLKLELSLHKYFRTKKGSTIFYNYILKNYHKNNVFDFGFIRLPNDTPIFLIIDLVLPYILTGKFFEYFQAEGSYEQFGVKIDSGDIAIDAGANSGIFSAYAASKGANVFAFEPVPETIVCLKQTLNINKNKFNIVPLALSDKTETTKIYIDSKGNGASSMMEDKHNGFVTVQSTTLDEWTNKENIKRIDFIKADIEGAERLMLKGAKNILREFKPKLSLCTYHYPDDPKIMKELILEANSTYKISQGTHKLFAS
jgi:FkbM family methyltransferase